jgi:hypothetical protein
MGCRRAIIKYGVPGIRDIRSKWEKFSLEMLITLATKAGMRVTLKRAA